MLTILDRVLYLYPCIFARLYQSPPQRQLQLHVLIEVGHGCRNHVAAARGAASVDLSRVWLVAPTQAAR